MKNKKPNQKPGQQPSHEIRLGAIRATIWENGREGEDAWYRITTSRLYKDGDAWRGTQSFRPNDLPALGKVLDLAHNWLWENGSLGAAREGIVNGDAGHDGASKTNGNEPYGNKRSANKQNGSKRNAKKENGRGKRVDGDGESVHHSRGGKSHSSRGGSRGTDSTSARKKNR